MIHHQASLPNGQQTRDAEHSPGSPLSQPPESGVFPKKNARSRPQHLLEMVCRAVGAAQGGIALLSSDGEMTDHVTFGVSEDVTAGLGHSPWSGELVRFILQQPLPVNLPDLSRQQPALGQAPGLPAMGPFLGVPLFCQGRARGGLYLARLPGDPPFGPRDEETVLPLRTWLEQGNLLEESRLFAQLRLLNQVAQTAAGSLDLPRILAVALRELERLLPLNICVVWLLEKAEQRPGPEGEDTGGSSKTLPSSFRLRLAESTGVPNERAEKLGLLPGLLLELDQTPFAECWKDGQALYADLEKPEERRSALAESLAGRGATSHFAVPLRTGDRTVGILHSVCTRPTGFTNEQIQLLYLVTDLLGPAISNCQLFERLRKAYDELRQTQEQLIQAEKMRALGELAGGMAHDFNNSLCGVLGFLELALVDQDLAPPLRGYLESARTCSLDAAQTVRRVQNFARWQRNELSVQLLDLNELVRQTLELTRHKWESLAHARGTRITVELLTEATTWVSGSAAELREVLTNLVFNAVDAMPQGGKLTVRTWNTATDIFLAVRDTGVGMSEAVRQRLFEPFFTTKGERGNGLGLSVTFGIVQRYGGEITVESAVGRGSNFIVRLPVSHDKSRKLQERNGSSAAEARASIYAVSASQSPSSTRPQPQPSSSCKGLRILVIEDEESIRRFLASGLKHLGHRPRLAADAQEGLTAFAEEHFDVVLTDLSLPGASGEEVARAVARISPGTPVVLLTGWSDQLRNEGQAPEGVTRVLGKPVLLNTLAATLSAVCQA